MQKDFCTLKKYGKFFPWLPPAIKKDERFEKKETFKKEEKL